MRILIIGKSNKTRILTDHLASNLDLLVFTTCENTNGNFINILPENVVQLREFALANEINLTILCDDSLMELEFNSDFNRNNLAILSPEPDAIRIAASKTTGKKFIYRNKIRTPRFAIFEKPQLAVEYARNNKFPLVIKPDKHYGLEGIFIAETFTGAKSHIENLFETGNKKILIEDYIEGKEVTFYVISDGFNPVIIDSAKSYLDTISVKGCDVVNNELKQKIYKEVILPTIQAISVEGNEYIGILGFDFIIDSRNNYYLIEYNTFFKEIDMQSMLEGTDVNWTELFLSAIDGTLLEKYSCIKPKNIHIASFRENNDIITVEASSKNMLKDKVLIEGYNKKELDEAERIWKS